MSVKPFFWGGGCSTQPVHHKIMLNWKNSPEKNLSKKQLKTNSNFLFTHLFFEKFNFLHKQNVLLLECS